MRHPQRGEGEGSMRHPQRGKGEGSMRHPQRGEGGPENQGLSLCGPSEKKITVTSLSIFVVTEFYF